MKKILIAFLSVIAVLATACSGIKIVEEKSEISPAVSNFTISQANSERESLSSEQISPEASSEDEFSDYFSENSSEDNQISSYEDGSEQSSDSFEEEFSSKISSDQSPISSEEESSKQTYISDEDSI